MSITLTLTGKSSVLRSTHLPALSLDGAWSVGLVDFQTYNSIPNVDECNNKFTYARLSEDVKTMDVPSTLTIPVGSYEVNDIAETLRKMMHKDIDFELYGNRNTLTCVMKCSADVDFSQTGSIGAMLGFEQKVYKANMTHVSSKPVNILSVNVVRINCNLVGSTYLNGRPTSTVHEFSIVVPPGFKIVEVPKTIIYAPVIIDSVGEVVVSIIDQDGRLVNFRNEEITLRLHLKRWGYNS